jgi:hypothetical protein
MSLTLLIVNIFNFFMLVVFPGARQSKLLRLLWQHRDEITFITKIEWVGLPSIEQLKSGDYETVEYVECRIDISPSDYLAWKIWPDGTLVKCLDRKRDRWINREPVIHFTLRTEDEMDPFASIRANHPYLKYRIQKVWLMNWFTAAMLKKITAEPYVMAKMGGIEVYDPLDIGHR